MKTRKRLLTKGLFTLCTSVLFLTGILAQSNIEVTGTVSDDFNDPVIGATVLVKGTNQGTVTNSLGSFTLSTSPDAILQITYIGYETQEIAVNNNRILHVTLRENVQTFDDVVVVAYGTAKKSSFTGSMTNIDGSKISRMNVTNVTESLQGLSAGVSVINNQGSPGSDAVINIRGIGSMSASTNPLYVLDGMPYDGALNSIAPSDIESITVLKDAAASSLYGSRAANGVIMITTKRGRSDKPSVNFKSSWGTSDIAVKFPKIAGPGEFYELWWEGLYNDAVYIDGYSDTEARAIASQNVLPTLLNATTNSRGELQYVHPYDSQTPVGTDGKLDPNARLLWNESDYDWYGAMFSKRLRQEYSVDVSGTTQDQKINYFFSGSFLDDKGFAMGHLFNRYTLRSNVTSKINKWVEAGVNLTYTHSKRSNANAQVRALRTMPTYASPWLRNTDNTDWVYSELTGEKMYDFGTYRKEWGGWNPIAWAVGDDNDNPGSYTYDFLYTDLVSGRAFAEASIMEGLKFRTSLSLDNSWRNNNYYSSAIHALEQEEPYGVAILNGGGAATQWSSRSTSTTWNNLLTYEKTFNAHHTINLLAGQELYSYRYNYMYAYGSGIPMGGLYQLRSTTKDYAVDSTKDKYGLFSWLGKAEYNYDNKYYISGSYRRDGSSRFHESNRWGNFYSAGASWRISQEEFMKSLDWLDNLTFKASYGTTGNDNLRDSGGYSIYYAWQGTYASQNLHSNAGLRASSLTATDLKWEKNVQFNTGLDFHLFNRFYGGIEYFTRRANDLLYYKELPLSSQAGNATGYYTNIGDIKNSGVEITLGALLLKERNFSWNIDANVTHVKNEIVSLPEGEYTFSGNWGTFKMVEGKSRYEYWAPSYAGVDPETGNVMYYKKIFNDDGSVRETVTTTDYTEVNVDSQKDFKGSSLPKIYGSFTNSFQLYDFDLSVMFYYSLGGKMLDYSWMESRTLRRGFSVVPEFLENRWQKPGDIAEYPRLSERQYLDTRQYSDKFIFTNNYLRLRNLTIGYNVPLHLTRKIGANHVRVYFAGDNLLTFGSAKKRGSDPETTLNGETNNGNGDGQITARMTLTGGIQITF